MTPDWKLKTGSTGDNYGSENKTLKVRLYICQLQKKILLHVVRTKDEDDDKEEEGKEVEVEKQEQEQEEEKEEKDIKPTQKQNIKKKTQSTSLN